MRSSVFALACSGCALSAGDKMPWPYATAPTGAERGGAAATAVAPDQVGTSTAQGGPTEHDRDDEAQPMLAIIGVEEAPTQPGVIAFTWPLAATGINSLFGERLDPLDGKRRFHGGIDLDGPYGALVVAAAPGLVAHAGWSQGHGRQVVIEHAGGFRTVYSHLSQVLVLAGAAVRAGDPVGQVGNSGRSTGPHLHFEVSRWEQQLDPLDLLGQILTLR